MKLRGLVLTLAFTLGVAPALAQTPAPQASLAETLHGPAKDAYDAATLLVANRDFAGAITKFMQAYGISKDPRLLYNAGVCEKNLHHYAKSSALLQRYRKDGNLAPDVAADVDAALAAMKSLVGTIVVTANVPGATVLVDGEAAGTTPLDTPVVLDLGKHTVSVTKDGFAPVEKAVDVAGGSEMPLKVDLVEAAHVATLVVSANDDATIAIDGKVAGSGRYDGQLHTGVHSVRVTAPGKQPYKADIELNDGERRTLQVTLEAEKSGSLLPWLIGGAVVVAGAAVGGYFLFKPDDKVNPPPAGKLATVNFSAFGR